MDFEVLKSYLFNLTESRLEFPYGPDTMVFKVLGRTFACVSWQSDPIFISLKCDPSQAIQLRKQYAGVVPGYHMNRTEWNSVFLDDDTISNDLLLGWVNDSYQTVISEMPGFLKNRIVKKIASNADNK